MKVAIISSGFESRSQRLQPIRSLLEMGQQMVNLGHHVILISDGATNLSAYSRLQELPLYRVPSVRSIHGLQNGPLVATITRESPDVLFWHLGLSSFLHHQFPRGLWQPIIGVLTSPIHYPHEILRLSPGKLFSNLDLVANHLIGPAVPGNLVRQAFSKDGLRGMLTLSKTTRRHLIEKGAPADQIWVAPPGVDKVWLDNCISVADRQKLRRQLGFSREDFVITYFGSPAPVRGLHTTLLAVQSAAQSYPEIKVLILSRRWADQWGRQTARLNQLIDGNDLRERVRVVDGFLEQSQLIQYLTSSDIVCLPFEIVPSDVPLSVLEAMALGKGVITTSVACLPELVADGRGFIVPPGSAFALANQITAIAETPSIALERGKRAKAYVQRNRTWEHMGKSLQKALTEVVR